ncbi:MAGE family-domain-containing protein [Diplogelasinospora grovesii]|uniref:MAGE family-domain-containing protein n=1 Tax=Diplogelasinospora grovesii TaxID=303347 RepID=A0AAN6N9Y7_9PEZI|nr:MAGE family-domain-containing protein [Diplogelasinospora grovesii]
MPVLQRRRRAAVDDDDDEMQHRDGAADRERDSDGDAEMSGVFERDESVLLVKKLVRYALACEYTRTPIRRDAIREKVLGPDYGRAFKKVFAGAQRELRWAFGVEMVEMPARDRSLMTAEQRRKAARSQNQKEPTSNSYMLVSILPDQYRTPDILTPPKVHSAEGEAAYGGLYTWLIAIIVLNGGELSDARLNKHLQRVNATVNMPSMNPNDRNAPSEKTEIVLQRMIKQGYIVKHIEAKGQGGEELVFWRVGPRGKVEVTKESVAALIRTVYGGTSDDLEKRIAASLKVGDNRTAAPANEPQSQAVADEASSQPASTARRQSSRRQAAVENDEDDEDDE